MPSGGLPFAGTSAGVDDRLGCLNWTKTGCKLVEQLIIGCRVKAANVDISVTGNAILETLLQALHLTRWREDCGHGLGHGRVLLQKLIEGVVRDRWQRWLSRSLHVQGRQSHLLGRGGGVS